MKLQKLIYFAHGWHLALYNEPLVTEPIYAWKFGPVIPSVYHEFKRFGYRPITETDWDDEEDGLGLPIIPPDDRRTIELLTRVWDVYRRFTAVQLSNMTHAPDTPWRVTWDRGEGAPELKIDDALIRRSFLTKIGKDADAAAGKG